MTVEFGFRYLVDLDYQGDPAWECIANQKDWLLKLLMSSQEDHKSKGINHCFMFIA